MSNSIQKPLNCRNARCGAMCSMAIAEIFSTKPSECPYFKYAPKEYDAEHNAKVRAKAIDEYNRELKAYLRRFSVHFVSDEDFDYIAEKLKGQKNE